MADAALYAVGGILSVVGGSFSFMTYKKFFKDSMGSGAADNDPLLYKEDEKDNGEQLYGWIFKNRKIQIYEELGRGNVGIVYRAKKEGLPCVVKHLIKPVITNKDFRHIQALRRLVHPNLVQCLGICPNYSTPKPKSDKKQPYFDEKQTKEESEEIELMEKKHGRKQLQLKNAFIIAYELMEVGPLFHALHDLSRRFDWERRLRIAQQIAEAMEHLHSQKLVHGNLSSVNVLLDADLVAKVSDFGMQKLADAKIEHSILWSAPEVLMGKTPKKEADVFSYGVILWELMTRRVPYVANVDRAKGNVRWQQVQKVKNGERPPVPEKLPISIEKCIVDCWSTSASKRPAFVKILQMLKLFPRNFDLKKIDQIEVKVDKKTGPESIDIVIPTKTKWMQDPGDVKLEGPGVHTIGQGSFGRVIATTFKGTKVAVKLIDMYAEVSRAQAQAFINELGLLCAVRNKNIVDFQGAVLSHEKYMCIIMELCSRGSLYDFLNNKKEHLDYKMQVGFLMQIAQAMEYLHFRFSKEKPILHCDLKSGNILLTENLEIKVCDFGLSQIVQRELVNSKGVLNGGAGNPYWTAPEVMAGADFSMSSDVYSFGIIAWEVFARKQPFEGMNPHQATLKILMEDARPTIPEFVPKNPTKLIEDCWGKDFKSRPMFDEIVTRLKEIDEQGIPREVLTMQNAKLYRKKTLVYAFRSKDRFVFYKSWGKSTSALNDYVLIGPGGDAYTCAADRFEATYELAGRAPHVYRKTSKILAKRMEQEFLLETLEGLEKGKVGSYLAQNPVKMEQWPIDEKTFNDTYELCPIQQLNTTDQKHPHTPKKRKVKFLR
mmetsp:Transcript_22763/g.33945  ORF Transcript_22763/g.33945 Transcript_22763/m.33945 type:complete len:828 (-) Transcript_22763:218-2701(-)|eukprot:CAMPEP_0167751968 /NCGR_PEP_ID=MMETSP0110_2-20121227/6873_1 /TAXON_ID=629695 /ORGANISM="Gymnochlora sp., Strain CCMP2014" /LENGTH=827 /DNA_ID=CAMNT_0007637523 /DNA_START=26 /DNA_END=2509 /DNA_ORIENTATION=+